MMPDASVLASTRTAPPAAPTLLDALERGASADAPLLVLHGDGPESRLGARDALTLARRWAYALAKQGASTGDPIALLVPTSVDFVGALLGTMLLGAIPLPLPVPMTFGPLDRHLEHLRRVVEHAGARLVVTTPRLRAAVERATADLAGVVTAEALGPEHAAGPTSLDPSTPALLQYTSGTTGQPKGALVSHRSILANAAAIADALELRSTDVGVSWLPLHHDMGLVGVLLTAIAHPYEVHLLPPQAFVMKPRRWLELVSEKRGTISTAPNFAYDLATRRVAPAGLDLSTWRAALDGAEPVHQSTLDRFAARFEGSGFSANAWRPVYGLAEATLAVTFHPAGERTASVRVDRHALEEESAARPSTDGTARTIVGVGVPVAETRIAVTTPDGRPVTVGRVGEIRVAGPGVMLGYYREPEASCEALTGGWLRTGDLGFVFAGRLFVSGRARELIIQAGRNVHPEDVEEIALDLDERIGSAAAFGRPNEETGTDDLVVVVEARGLGPLERESLAAQVRGELLSAIGVRADEVAFWPTGSIPRTPSGKVRRRECARRHAERGAA